MTLNDGFDRTVSAWLDEQAGQGMPGYLDEVLARTTRTRQRPWWSSLERWLPVQTTLRLAPVPRVAWLLLVLALVVGLAVAVLAIGSRPRLPAPFGPARNGALVITGDGDISSLDPATGVKRSLIADPAFDFGVAFSRDGTKFSFLRAPHPDDPNGGLILEVADLDGTNAHPVSPEVAGLDSMDWSPDGTRIAFLSRPTGGSGPGVINVVRVDGGGLTTLDVGRPAHLLTWLPPDGREIVFRGEQLAETDPPAGIFAVSPDGTGLRQISTRPAVDKYDYQDVAVSPDGRHVAYHDSGQVWRLHVLDMETAVDITLPDPTGTTPQTGGVFSPDGRSLVYQRWIGTRTTELVVAPADGSGTGVAIGPHAPTDPDGPTINNYVFTPDGTAIVANYGAENITRRLPVDGSEGSVLASGSQSFAAYQRLAP